MNWATTGDTFLLPVGAALYPLAVAYVMGCTTGETGDEEGTTVGATGCPDADAADAAMGLTRALDATTGATMGKLGAGYPDDAA